jgi:hypothetical protein
MECRLLLSQSLRQINRGRATVLGAAEGSDNVRVQELLNCAPTTILVVIILDQRVAKFVSGAGRECGIDHNPRNGLPDPGENPH